MKNPKWLSDAPKRNWKGTTVLVSISRDGRPPFVYEGIVIDTFNKSPRVLVKPVNANQYSLPKVIDSGRLEILAYGN